MQLFWTVLSAATLSITIRSLVDKDDARLYFKQFRWLFNNSLYHYHIFWCSPISNFSHALRHVSSALKFSSVQSLSCVQLCSEGANINEYLKIKCYLLSSHITGNSIWHWLWQWVFSHATKGIIHEWNSW